MKAFEEWLDKQHPNWTGILISTGEEAWKSALEWFLKEFAYALDYDKYWIVECLYEELGKELNPDD